MELLRRRPILVPVICIVTLGFIYYFITANSSPKSSPFLLPTLVMPTNSSSVYDAEFFNSSRTNSSDGTNEETQKNGLRLTVQQFDQSQMDECLKFASTADRKCYDLIRSEGWEFNHVTSQGDTIWCMSLPYPAGKICKLTGILNVNAATAVALIYDEAEKIPSWSDDTSESRIIQKIDENTDILYQATSTLAGGAISPRDFVLIRHRGQYEMYKMHSSVSASFVGIPERDNFVRGESGFGCLAARDLGSGGDKCEIAWTFNPHFKGWVPDYIVNLFIPTGMTDFTKSLRTHISRNKY